MTDQLEYVWLIECYMRRLCDFGYELTFPIHITLYFDDSAVVLLSVKKQSVRNGSICAFPTQTEVIDWKPLFIRGG